MSRHTTVESSFFEETENGEIEIRVTGRWTPLTPATFESPAEGGEWDDVLREDGESLTKEQLKSAIASLEKALVKLQQP